MVQRIINKTLLPNGIRVLHMLHNCHQRLPLIQHLYILLRLQLLLLIDFSSLTRKRKCVNDENSPSPKTSNHTSSNLGNYLERINILDASISRLKQSLDTFSKERE